MRNREIVHRFVRDTLKLGLEDYRLIFQERKAIVLLLTPKKVEIDYYDCSVAFREYVNYEWVDIEVIDEMKGVQFNA